MEEMKDVNSVELSDEEVKGAAGGGARDEWESPTTSAIARNVEI